MFFLEDWVISETMDFLFTIVKNFCLVVPQLKHLYLKSTHLKTCLTDGLTGALLWLVTKPWGPRPCFLCHLLIFLSISHCFLLLLSDILLIAVIKKTKNKNKTKNLFLDFPGDPVVKTPPFQCRGNQFDPCLGSSMPQGVAKNKII